MINNMQKKYLINLQDANLQEFLSLLLQDKNSGKNIIWATEDFEKYGFDYLFNSEMTSYSINSVKLEDLQPRVSKSKENQKGRTREKAEVFTPAWTCDEMNSYFDSDWFSQKRKISNGKIKYMFDDKKTLKGYVDLRKLEITCGEAPFVISRYDTTTGEMIEVKNRIGFLDRKLLAISQYINDKEEWFNMVCRAYESSYGYEYQGDNLLKARINLFYTFLEFYEYKWKLGFPSDSELKRISNIISRNFWQMDGLTYTIPNTDIKCKIYNWRSKKNLNLVGEGNMKFDYVIGNPPYQITKGGTKNVDIWPDFVRESNKISNNVCLIHPARWIIPKKQMQATHNMIMESGLKSFNYFPDASKVFYDVLIDGGVSITCFKNGYEGDIKYYNNGEDFGTFKDGEKFISNKFEAEAYRKIFTYFENVLTIEHRIIGNIGSLGGGEYGYSKTKHIDYLSSTNENMEEPLLVWANNGFGKGARFDWHYIDKKKLSNVPEKVLSSRKVLIDKKGHSISTGRGNIINNIPKIVDALAIASGDVLFVFPENENDYELELIKSMFMTKTVRFLMSITQKDLYVRGFENVPDYTMFMPLLDGKLFTDEWFYKTFNFSNDLVKWIDTHVSPKKEEDKEEE